MSFVPGYEYDIFISYAHDDNSTHHDDKRNWVSLFDHYLRARARGRGKELKVFRDAQLGHFTGVNEQLANLIAKSAIFICVVSPNYAKSEWCLWELEQMIHGGGLNRVLRIGKYPLDDSELTPKQRALLRQTDGLLEARFYDADKSTNSPGDLQPELFQKDLDAFYKRVNPLVDNIIARLKELSAAQEPTSQTIPARSAIEVSGETQVAVYLAETTKDLANERELVRSELVQFNYRVLPHQPLPHDFDQLREAIHDHLQQSKLSIHLVGANYGMIPEDEDRSIPHIQYDLACGLAADGRLEQIVWSPSDLTPNGRQQQFVTNLKNTSPDYLQMKLEDLKTIILKKLQPVEPDLWEDHDTAPLNVCLYHHQQDLDSVKPLFAHLKLRELFAVRLLEESSQDRKQLLQSSDAVLLYHGAADEGWVANGLRLIRRYTAIGRARPLLAKAIYTGPPPTAEKEVLRADCGSTNLEDVVIIGGYGEFTPTALAPFIERINAAKGGTR
ncbi:MAG: toll/interleukin-1 receptor domain-containing protein [Acidobacteriota bacterium]